MRVALVDLASTKGHRLFNSNMLRALKANGLEVTTISSGTAFFDPSDVDIVIPDFFYAGLNKVAKIHVRKLREIGRVLWAINHLKRLKPWDLILVSSFETVSFSLLSASFCSLSRNIIAFLHYNIDDAVRSKLKRSLLRSVSKEVTFAALEPFIADFASRLLRRRVVHVPEILSFSDLRRDAIQGSLKPSGRTLVFAPSGSNTSDLWEHLISDEPYFRDRGILIVSKGRTEYVGDSVIVKQYFTDAEYEKFMAECSVVLVPLREGFNYRASGVIYDACVAGKPVISNQSMFADYMHHKYGNPVYIVQDISAESIEKGIDFVMNEWDKSWNYEEFLYDHSVQAFVEALRSAGVDSLY